MKVIADGVEINDKIRKQCIEWKGMNWWIECNDRFKPNDFESKVHCEICGPETFVPKVFVYRRHKLCLSCLTRMCEMLQMATLEDCKRDRHHQKRLEQKLITIEMEKTVRKI